MSNGTIFHICTRQAWEHARRNGRYAGSDIDRRDGFIHFSTAAQVRETAAVHLRGIEGLVLLEVDAGTLGSALKWEDSRDGEPFPHLHMDLPVAAVTAVHELPVGDDGLHAFPPGL